MTLFIPALHNEWEKFRLTNIHHRHKSLSDRSAIQRWDRWMSSVSLYAPSRRLFINTIMSDLWSLPITLKRSALRSKQPLVTSLRREGMTPRGAGISDVAKQENPLSNTLTANDFFFLKYPHRKRDEEKDGRKREKQLLLLLFYCSFSWGLDGFPWSFEHEQDHTCHWTSKMRSKAVLTLATPSWVHGIPVMLLLHSLSSSLSWQKRATTHCVDGCSIEEGR